MLLQIALGVVGVFAAAGVLAHIAARLEWHRRVVRVRRQNLSALGLWGKANPWRIILHDGLTDDQNRSVSAHEWSHVRDHWLTGLIGLTLWKLIRRRDAVLWTEGRAYAESVRHGRDLAESARALSRTEPGITEPDAMRAIRRWLDA